MNLTDVAIFTFPSEAAVLESILLAVNRTVALIKEAGFEKYLL